MLRLFGQFGIRAHKSASVLKPGLFNPRGIGWLVPRSHAPFNVGLVWVVVHVFAVLGTGTSVVTKSSPAKVREIRKAVSPFSSAPRS